MPLTKKSLIAYICHPVAGDVKGNLDKIRHIIKWINTVEPNIVPFAPYYSDVVSLDDSNPDDRMRGLKNCQAVILSECIDQIRVYGPIMTVGMEMEILVASRLKKNVTIVCSHMNVYSHLKSILPLEASHRVAYLAPKFPLLGE